METPFLDQLIEDHQNHIESVEASSYAGIQETRKQLAELEAIKAITVTHCCKSDSEQLKAFKNDETVALDGALEVKIINIESKVLVKVIEDDTLMWVKKDRLKREYSF